MPYIVYSKSKEWKEFHSVSYKNGDREITSSEIGDYVESHGLENGSYFNLNIDDIADEILTSSPDETTTTTVSETTTQSQTDESVEETPSVQSADDGDVKEEASSDDKRVTVEELIKQFLTEELVEELASEVDKLPKTTSLDSFKKEVIKVLCKHIEPQMVVGKDDDKVSRWSIEDLSSILSIDMVSEFAQKPNTKKKVAIEAAVNKYGKATMVTYGLLISSITTQLVVALYN